MSWNFCSFGCYSKLVQKWAHWPTASERTCHPPSYMPRPRQRTQLNFTDYASSHEIIPILLISLLLIFSLIILLIFLLMLLFTMSINWQAISRVKDSLSGHTRKWKSEPFELNLLLKKRFVSRYLSLITNRSCQEGVVRPSLKIDYSSPMHVNSKHLF